MDGSGSVRVRRWESGMEGSRRRGAIWRKENKWGTVIGRLERQW